MPRVFASSRKGKSANRPASARQSCGQSCPACVQMMSATHRLFETPLALADCSTRACGGPSRYKVICDITQPHQKIDSEVRKVYETEHSGTRAASLGAALPAPRVGPSTTLARNTPARAAQSGWYFFHDAGPGDIEAELEGKQPVHLTIWDLLAPLPEEWSKQKIHFVEIHQLGLIVQLLRKE